MSLVCSACEEKDAVVKVTITDMDGRVLDHDEFCEACAGESAFEMANSEAGKMVK